MAEITTTVIAAIATAFGGVLLELLSQLLNKKIRGKPVRATPGERIQASINNLSKASQEVDILFQEIVMDLRNRELALAELQTKNNELAAQEEELRKRIAALKDIPVDVAEYFQKINQQNLEQLDKRSGRRDLLFFILGIVLSALVSIGLQFAGLA